MPINNTNSIGPAKYNPEIRRRVYFTGDVALKVGMALVWDWAPASGKPAVGQCVKIPTSSYKFGFAGVVLEAKAAKTGGQWVDIALPGSICYCLVGPAVTAGSTVVVFSQTDGKFGLRTTTSITVASTTATITAMEESGCGCALALETDATPASAGRLIKCKLLEGTDATAPAFSYS